MKKIIVSIVVLTNFIFANSYSYNDYLKVKYSEPIYEYVYEEQPQTKCEDIRQKIRVNNSRTYSNDSLGIDTLVGVAAGAVIGSQIGKGNGRVAAQIVGGLLGGKVAHEIRNNYHPNENPRYKYVTKKECYETYKTVKKRVLTGYKNYFIYDGVEHSKITNKPKKRIKISHSIDF